MSYPMKSTSVLLHGPASHKSLMTENLPFYHQDPPVQQPQQLNQGLREPMICPPVQPQQIARQKVEEDIPVVNSEHPLFGLGKPHLHWTHELHARFVRAISELGGSFNATPKGILKKMKVKGLTREQIKSHLQKFRASDKKRFTHQDFLNRADNHSFQLSGQGSSTSMSTASMNGKGLESYLADIEAYGKLLQSSEIPTYDQNLMFAPMGDFQDNTKGSKIGL